MLAGNVKLLLDRKNEESYNIHHKGKGVFCVYTKGAFAFSFSVKSDK